MHPKPSLLRSGILALCVLISACSEESPPSKTESFSEGNPTAPTALASPETRESRSVVKNPSLEPDETVIPKDLCENEKLPKNVRWVGASFEAGDYEKEKLGFTLPGDAHEATLVSVQVGEPGLVGIALSSYDPRIWKISAAPGTKIVAVIASGYHRQQVMGLPAGTPVSYATLIGKSPCGYSHDADSLSELVSILVGKRPERVESFNSGAPVTLGDATGPFTSNPSDTNPQVYNKKLTMFQGGPLGLKEALESGHLRSATPEEIEVAKKITKSSGESHFDNSEAYVVTKAMVLPSGLAGGNGGGTTFIVPKGVPRPKGDIGHTAVVDLNTNECISSSFCP